MGIGCLGILHQYADGSSCSDLDLPLLQWLFLTDTGERTAHIAQRFSLQAFRN